MVTCSDILVLYRFSLVRLVRVAKGSKASLSKIRTDDKSSSVWEQEKSKNTYQTQFQRSLKAVDTIGNCQRTDFSLGVSQHMHKKTNL